MTGPCAEHGEGPVWTPRWGGLRLVDMLAGDVLSLRDGEVERRHVGPVAAMLRPRRDGGAVIALARGFAYAADDLTGVTPLGELWQDPAVRMNEGGCAPGGRLYCGSMAYSAAPGRGRLYRLDGDGRVEAVLTGVGISNGIGWSPSGETAYYVDTLTGRVDAFDFDSDRGLYGRRVFARVPPERGAPDGLTVDAAGFVWVALWGGAAVWRFTPDGRLDGAVELPVTQVTACTFGGPDLSRLYITTSRQEIAPASQPDAGAVFAADVGVRGLPVLEFHG